MPIRLLVKSKAETGDRPSQEVLLSAEKVSLGRDKVCEVVLNDQVVSRRHAQIVREGALYFLEDIGSSYGTRINGSALPANEKRLLKNGDVIAIGPYDVTFDRIADVVPDDNEKTSFVAKRVVKDALRGLAAGVNPFLRVMNGPLEGTRYELGDAQEVVIGREECVDILLDNDDLVSRRHVKIRRDWSGTTIEDLGSRNGIKVNRKTFTSGPLKDRDEIEVGSTRFLFLDPSEVREAVVVPQEKPPPPVPEAPAEPEQPKEEEKAAEPEPAKDPEQAGPAEEEAKGEAPEAVADAKEGDLADAEDHTEASAPPVLDSTVEEPGAEPLPPLGGALKDHLSTRAGWRSLLPVLIVLGIAIVALAALAVTFFVM